MVDFFQLVKVILSTWRFKSLLEYLSIMSDKKLSRIYYNPRGYWKGITAIKKLAEAAKVDEDVARV